MKQLLVFLLSLVCVVSYSQKRNEFGLKLVKKMNICDLHYNNTISYELNYDINNNLTKVCCYRLSNINSNKKELLGKCVRNNNKLIQTEYSDGVIMKGWKYDITLNKKGFLLKRVDSFPSGNKYIDEYFYNEDDELIQTVHTELDSNGNYFDTPWGGKLVPLKKQINSQKKEPQSKYVEYECLNDANINFEKYGFAHLEVFWIPNKYKRWVPVIQPDVYRWEYKYDENHNIINVLKYSNNKIIEKIEIEYLY